MARNNNGFDAWANADSGSNYMQAFDPGYTALYAPQPMDLQPSYMIPSRAQYEQPRWAEGPPASAYTNNFANRRVSLDDTRIPNISVRARSVSPQPPIARRASQDLGRRINASPSLTVRRQSRQMEPQPQQVPQGVLPPYQDYVFPPAPGHRRSSSYNAPSMQVTPPTPTDYFKPRPAAMAPPSGPVEKKKRPKARTNQDLLMEMPIPDRHLRSEDRRVLRHSGLLVPIQGLDNLKAVMSQAFDKRGFQLASYVEWAPHGVQGRQTNKIRIFVCGQGIRLTQGAKFEKTGACGFEVRFEAQHHKSDATAVWRLSEANLSHGELCGAHRHH